MTKQSTLSMQARAAQLIAQSKTWTRGSRKADGVAFVLFPSSKPKQAWFTRVDGEVCNCPGFFYRGTCAHAIAVRADYEQARGEGDREPMTDLYTRCGRVGCEAICESLICDDCVAIAERQERMAAARRRVAESVGV